MCVLEQECDGEEYNVSLCRLFVCVLVYATQSSSPERRLHDTPWNHPPPNPGLWWVHPSHPSPTLLPTRVHLHPLHGWTEVSSEWMQCSCRVTVVCFLFTDWINDLTTDSNSGPFIHSHSLVECRTSSYFPCSSQESLVNEILKMSRDETMCVTSHVVKTSQLRASPSSDTRDAQLLSKDPHPPLPSLITSSILSDMWPICRKTHLLANYAINIQQADEAFILCLLKAADESWHHDVSDDLLKISGCISCSATLEWSALSSKDVHIWQHMKQ